MPGGVHPAGQVAYFVGAGDAGQESKHDLSVPTRCVLARRRLDENLDVPDTAVTGEFEDEYLRATVSANASASHHDGRRPTVVA
jgi:hypothetical protein